MNRTFEDDIRLALVGKTGTGKSTTGNSILGLDILQSSASGESATSECIHTETIRDDRRVILIDTPGFLDTRLSVEETTKLIKECVTKTEGGIHCFLLTIQVGRFSPEDNDTIQQFFRTFGNMAKCYTIVIFTKLDTLRISKSDEEKFKQLSDDDSLETDYNERRLKNYSKEEKLKIFIKLSHSSIRKVLADCGNRYIGFSNNETGRQMTKQIDRLFCLIKATIAENKVSCYTTRMLSDHEQKQKEQKARKRRLARAARERKERIKAESATIEEETTAYYNMKKKSSVCNIL